MPRDMRSAYELHSGGESFMRHIWYMILKNLLHRVAAATEVWIEDSKLHICLDLAGEQTMLVANICTSHLVFGAHKWAPRL